MIALVVRPLIAVLVAGAIDHAVTVEALPGNAGESAGAFRPELTQACIWIAAERDLAGVGGGAKGIGDLTDSIIIANPRPAEVIEFTGAVGVIVATALTTLADMPNRAWHAAAAAILRVRIGWQAAAIAAVVPSWAVHVCVALALAKETDEAVLTGDTTSAAVVRVARNARFATADVPAEKHSAARAVATVLDIDASSRGWITGPAEAALEVRILTDDRGGELTGAGFTAVGATVVLGTGGDIGVAALLAHAVAADQAVGTAIGAGRRTECIARKRAAAFQPVAALGIRFARRRFGPAG
jgi:hypothetical protein